MATLVRSHIRHTKSGKRVRVRAYRRGSQFALVPKGRLRSQGHTMARIARRTRHPVLRSHMKVELRRLNRYRRYGPGYR